MERAAQLLCIALARYPDRFDWRSASGIAYLAFLATMPLTGVAGPPDFCHIRPAADDPSGCYSLKTKRQP